MRKNFLLLYSLFVVLFIDWMLGGFVLRIPFTLTFILFAFLAWVLPGILLWKIEKGRKIYFINLALGLIAVLLLYLLNLKTVDSPKDIGANLHNIELLLLSIFVWLIWGWALLLFAGLKKYKREAKS